MKKIDKKNLKKIVRNQNIPSMLLSLLLAVLVWGYVVGVENPQKETDLYDITVRYEGLELLDDRDLVIVDGLDETVDLRVRGRRTDLMNLSEDTNVSVTVNVSSINASGTFTPLVEVSIPSSVELVRQSVNRMPLKVENMLTRQVAVDVMLDPASTIADDHMIGELTSSPESIRVRGPESIVSSIDVAATRILRENISTTIVTEEMYTFLDSAGVPVAMDGLEVDTDRITATVPVLMVKTIPLTVEFIEGGGATLSNVKREITPASITLSGDPELLEGLNQISLGEIDLSRVFSSTQEVRDIVLPNGVTSVSGEESATIDIELTGLKTRTLSVHDILLTGVPEGLQVDLVTQKLIINVRGPAETVDLITVGNIRVEVDLTGQDLPLGQQTVSATVSLAGYSNAGILGTDFKVNINISRAEVAPDTTTT